jgi:prepilin signal peptidase PulO-like enzyme (type II secretory pathway)
VIWVLKFENSFNGSVKLALSSKKILSFELLTLIGFLTLEEQAQLSLLRNRLVKIRKNKRNTTILALAVTFAVAIIIQLYWKDFLFGFVVWLSLELYPL